MAMWISVSLASVWGGLLALERRAFLQAMFSRPLVAATGTGWLLGDVSAGLFVGLFFELFYLGSASLGAALPDHDTLAAVGTAAAASTMAEPGTPAGPAVWSLSILIFVGLGRIGRHLDRALERYSTRLAQKAVTSAEQGELARAVRQNLWAIWPHFLVFAAATLACAVAGVLLRPYVDVLPARLAKGLEWSYPAMTSVAGAIAARGSHARHAGWYAGIAAGVVTFAAALLSIAGGGL